MTYSHQLVPPIFNLKEYRRIKSASVELAVPLQSASPVTNIYIFKVISGLITISRVG